MRSIACLILFVAGACASSTSKEAQPKNGVPPVQEEAGAPGGSTTPGNSETTRGSGTSKGMAEPASLEEEEMPMEAAGDCVKECVAARQMQATSAEQIEADCQAKCSENESATLPE